MKLIRSTRLERTSNRAFVLIGVFSGILVLPLFAAETPPERVIHVTAAASLRFQENVIWQKEIQERLSLANRIFEKNFGIRFVVENFTTWEPQDETRAMSLLVEELAGRFPLGPDSIVIGFHPMDRTSSAHLEEDADTVGTAAFFRGVVVIRDPAQELPPPLRRVVMAHELSHLFGAVHVDADKAIMRPALPKEPQLQLDSENVEIVRLAAGVDFRTGIDSLSNNAVDGLIASYEKLIRSNPKSDFYYQLGLFYRKRGQDARAVSTWEEAVRFHYDDPYIHRELGYHYFQSARYDRAIQELGSAVAHFILPSQKQDRIKTYNFLGVAYYYKGNLDEAVFNWLQGLAAAPDDPGLQTNLATAYLEKGDLERGVTELEKLLAKNPTDITTLSNLGGAYFQKKEYAKAVEYYQSALAKRPPSQTITKEKLLREVPESAIRTNLGLAYLQLGKLDDALQELQKARIFPDAGYETRRGLAQVYLQKKDYAKALQELQEAKGLKQDDPYLYSWLADIYHETHKPREAMAAAQEGLRYAQGNLKASLHKNLGYLYAQEKDFKNAEAQLKSALNLDWNDAQTHTQMAAVYANQGKKEEAGRSLSTALRLNPGFEPAKKLAEAMKSIGSGQKNR